MYQISSLVQKNESKLGFEPRVFLPIFQLSSMATQPAEFFSLGMDNANFWSVTFRDQETHDILCQPGPIIIFTNQAAEPLMKEFPQKRPPFFHNHLYLKDQNTQKHWSQCFQLENQQTKGINCTPKQYANCWQLPFFPRKKQASIYLNHININNTANL